MAILKFLKGLGKNLNTSTNSGTTHNGYIYFSTDDGKMYIDITDGETPTIGTNSSEGNRINVNDWQGVTVLNCGDSSQ